MDCFWMEQVIFADSPIKRKRMFSVRVSSGKKERKITVLIYKNHSFDL